MKFNIKPSRFDDRDYIYKNDSTEVLREFVDLRHYDDDNKLKKIIKNTQDKDEVCLKDGLQSLKEIGEISLYQKLISIYYITQVLNHNKPVVFGMEVYESFMDLNERISTVTFPGRKEKSLGGYAMCMVGYDLPRELFLAKNTFGKDWGMHGYCWIPFNYIRQEGYDCCTFDIEP